MSDWLGGIGSDGCLDLSDGHLRLTVLYVSKPAAVTYTHITVTVKIKESLQDSSKRYVSAARVPLTACDSWCEGLGLGDQLPLVSSLPRASSCTGGVEQAVPVALITPAK